MYTVLDVHEHRSHPPAWLYAASEPARVLTEAVGYFSALPVLLNGPRGDGHAVMTLPGFMASDLSTRWLRRLLRQLNYDVHTWQLGRNTGRIELIDALTSRFLSLSNASAGKRFPSSGKVSAAFWPGSLPVATQTGCAWS